MSKKYYQMIADRICAAYNSTGYRTSREVLDKMILDLCADFKADNANFDAHKFANACKGIK